MWEINSGKAKVHLLGSIHVGHPTFYPLPENIEQAFRRSPNLAVEVDVQNLDARKYNELINRARTEVPNGKKGVSKEFAARIKDALFAKRLDPDDYYNRYKFWYLFELLAQQRLPQGIRPEYGVDVHFLKRAQQDKKTVHELESVEQQLKMLEQLGQDSPELYYNFLNDPIQKSISLVSMIRLWKQGEPRDLAEALFQPLQKEPSYAPIYKKLFFERNKKMAGKIVNYLKTGSHYFVVIGAGHLVGDKGIPELLKAKGYNIKQVFPQVSPAKP